MSRQKTKFATCARKTKGVSSRSRRVAIMRSCLRGR
jgi:hypothetical protein